MEKRLFWFVIGSVFCHIPPLSAVAIQAEQHTRSSITLHRLAQPDLPFNKCGRQFALLGFEGGQFEAWGYPLKLFRNFEFSFLMGSSTRSIPAREIVRTIDVSPALTSLTFVYQSFRVRAHYVTAIDEPCAVIFLEVNATEPLTIICSFLPVLQPMWPAGIGGQYAHWNSEMKAYLISEPTRQNHAFLGSPAASGISYTPAHMLSDLPSEFKIEITRPARLQGQWIPVCMAGGKGSRDSLKALYQRTSADPFRILERAVSHYQNLLMGTLAITTPDSSINRAFIWAKVALDNLMVDHKELGYGLIAGLGASGTSGRPGFGWFFGGDAYINSLALNACGAAAHSRSALLFTQQYQRHDGKMAHEISQAAGYIDWFGKYPYAYIHGDTSPFYIVATHDYFLSTADTAFLRSSWPVMEKAYAWCLSTDANNDGLMDNPKAGLGSVEYGALTNLTTDIYTGSLSVRMAQCYGEMAEVLKKKKIARDAKAHHEKARRSFDEKFWDQTTLCYSNAFNDKNEHIKEVSPWIAMAAVLQAGDPRHTLQSLQRLSRADLSTDWGTRSISNKSRYYAPLNYNYGAVWPFLSGFVATGQLQYHLLHPGFGNLLANCRHTFDNNLGSITELYSGAQNYWPQEAVSQQGFSSSGVILPLVQGLMGLAGDAGRKQLRFAPQLPAHWKQTQIDNYRLGSSSWSFTYGRRPGCVTITTQAQNGRDYQLTLAPILGAGTRIDSVLVNGKRAPFHLNTASHAQQIVVTMTVRELATKTMIYYRPGLEIVPPVQEARLGDENKGVKIISMQQHGSVIEVRLEGVAGRTCTLRLEEAARIAEIDGAFFNGEEIQVPFPHGCGDDFVEKTIRVYLAK